MGAEETFPPFDFEEELDKKERLLNLN